MSAEYPEWCNCETPTARKQHKCCECRGAIKPGERYHKFVGVWSGEFESFTRCVDCEAMAEEVNKGRDFDDQITLGGLLEDCSERDGDEQLSKMAGIMAKRGAKIPDWASERLNEVNEVKP